MKFSLRSLFIATTAAALYAWFAVTNPEIAILAAAVFILPIVVSYVMFLVPFGLVAAVMFVAQRLRQR